MADCDPDARCRDAVRRAPRFSLVTLGRYRRAGIFMADCGAVAQLVEHLHGMERVRGSIPLSSTKSLRSVTLSMFRFRQLHNVTCTRGRKRLTLAPVPVSIAWIALGVEMKRTSSFATGFGTSRRSTWVT